MYFNYWLGNKQGESWLSEDNKIFFHLVNILFSD